MMTPFQFEPKLSAAASSPLAALPAGAFASEAGAKAARTSAELKRSFASMLGQVKKEAPSASVTAPAVKSPQGADPHHQAQQAVEGVKLKSPHSSRLTASETRVQSIRDPEGCVDDSGEHDLPTDLPADEPEGSAEFFSDADNLAGWVPAWIPQPLAIEAAAPVDLSAFEAPFESAPVEAEAMAVTITAGANPTGGDERARVSVEAMPAIVNQIGRLEAARPAAFAAAQAPATQTPAAQTPAAQTPAAQRLAVQTPATQTPATQRLAVQTPATQTPATQTPPAQTLVTQTSVTQTPVTRTPATPTPATQTPATQTPVTQTPVTQTPVTQTPVTQTPVTQTPVTQTPAVQTLATQTPATQTPATQTPATQMPATQTPATQMPATETPATQTPATQTPAQETRQAEGVWLTVNDAAEGRAANADGERSTQHDAAGAFKLPAGLNAVPAQPAPASNAASLPRSSKAEKIAALSSAVSAQGDESTVSIIFNNVEKISNQVFKKVDPVVGLSSAMNDANMSSPLLDFSAASPSDAPAAEAVTRVNLVQVVDEVAAITEQVRISGQQRCVVDLDVTGHGKLRVEVVRRADHVETVLSTDSASLRETLQAACDRSDRSSHFSSSFQWQGSPDTSGRGHNGAQADADARQNMYSKAEPAARVGRTPSLPVVPVAPVAAPVLSANHRLQIFA